MATFEFKPDETFGAELEPEVKDFMKTFMIDSSEKPTIIPRFFYHATPVKNLTSILENGLKTHEVFGEIYFCEKEKQALKFIKRPCVILRVSTADLDKEYIRLSKDHVKTRERNFEAYTYYLDVQAKQIKSWQVFR